jgi:hypothetical protein
MNRKLIAGLALIGLLFFFEACKESSTTESPGEIEVDAGYFPHANGSYYKYSIIKIDSLGTQLIGVRSSFYNGDTLIANTGYQVQIDTIEIASQTTINHSYFRTTESGAFYFLDTTGLSASVPDSVLQFITFDEQIRLLLFPMYNGTSWPSFRMNYVQGSFSFTPVEVRGAYQGKETIFLPPLFTSIEAAKIKFTLSIRLSPIGSPVIFEATGWLSENIGFVKWEGNGTIVSAFTGGGIDFDDTTSVVTQNLIEYVLPE